MNTLRSDAPLTLSQATSTVIRTGKRRRSTTTATTDRQTYTHKLCEVRILARILHQQYLDTNRPDSYQELQPSHRRSVDTVTREKHSYQNRQAPTKNNNCYYRQTNIHIHSMKYIHQQGHCIYLDSNSPVSAKASDEYSQNVLMIQIVPIVLNDSSHEISI